MGLLDMIGHKYPSTDFHELNLDWCIASVLQLQKAFEDFSAGNKLIFANPLQHDLTKTYAKNTIVVDSVSGSAYLSLSTVPVGVQLDNSDYWLPVFDFAGYITRANQNFTDHYFSGTDRTPVALAVGDWVVLDDVLYKVIVAMAADDLFIVDTNIVHFTVEQFLKDFITSVNTTLTNWYNQMTGTINQYKNDIDASELAYRQQLAQDIANTTASLEAQLQAAISGATVDSEVINARVGWDNTTYNTLRDAIVDQIINCVHGNKEWYGGGKGCIYLDFNDCLTNTIYFYSPSNWANVSNQPVNKNGTLVTMSVNNATDVGKIQLYFTNDRQIYFRYKFTSNNDWLAWRAIATEADLVRAITGKGVWTSGGHGYIITDLNDADTNSIYFFSPSSADWANMQNFPTKRGGTLLTFSVGTSEDVGKMQIYIPGNVNEFYMRMKWGINSNWTVWQQANTHREVHILKVASGTYDNEFTNLKDGIDFATAKMNSVVYVHAGTWNILDELGQDYLDGVGYSQRGIVLKNKVRVICLPDAHFVCNYTGSDEDVQTWLAVFNSGEYGFTLENADIVGANIRYLIHDERDTNSDYYENKYFNCHLNMDTRQCIGGGLGKHGQVVIDSCWFTSGANPNYDFWPVFYHNTGASSGASNITVKNCYFAGARETFSVRWHGTSTDMTRAYVCNNSFGIAPTIFAEQSGDVTVNVELIAYCNEIRS